MKGARARSADFEDGSANPSVSPSDSNSASDSLQFPRSFISLTDERPRKMRSVDADLSSQVSPLEELPRELIWKIFEYVPEMICELRLTSRILQSTMDDYALQPSTILLVKSEVELNLRDGATVKVCLGIRKSKVFKLRLRLRNPCLDLVNRINRPKRSIIIMKVGMIVAEYECNLNTPTEGDDLLEIIGESLGRKINNIHLIDCIERPIVVSKLLKDYQITRVIFQTDVLSFEDTDFILKFIMQHKVDQLSLRITIFSMSSPAQTLLRFSLSVRAIQIFQNNDPTIFPNTNYFLGYSECNWAPLIVDMLSNKLDTFVIYNFCSPYFFSSNDVEILKECIPKLKKTIFFATSCTAYPNGFKQCKNEYLVEAHPSTEFTYPFLQIKHISRQSEVYSFF